MKKVLILAFSLFAISVNAQKKTDWFAELPYENGAFYGFYGCEYYTYALHEPRKIYHFEDSVQIKQKCIALSVVVDGNFHDTMNFSYSDKRGTIPNLESEESFHQFDTVKEKSKFRVQEFNNNNQIISWKYFDDSWDQLGMGIYEYQGNQLIKYVDTYSTNGFPLNRRFQEQNYDNSGKILRDSFRFEENMFDWKTFSATQDFEYDSLDRLAYKQLSFRHERFKYRHFESHTFHYHNADTFAYKIDYFINSTLNYIPVSHTKSLHYDANNRIISDTSFDLSNTPLTAHHYQYSGQTQTITDFAYKNGKWDTLNQQYIIYNNQMKNVSHTKFKWVNGTGWEAEAKDSLVYDNKGYKTHRLMYRTDDTNSLYRKIIISRNKYANPDRCQDITYDNQTGTEGLYDVKYYYENLYPSSHIKESSKAGETVSIFPNPGTDKINIDVKGINKASYYLRIFNTSGQLQKEVQFNGNQYTLDVSDLSTGLYLINIYNSKHTEIIDYFKFLKK